MAVAAAQLLVASCVDAHGALVETLASAQKETASVVRSLKDVETPHVPVVLAASALQDSANAALKKLSDAETQIARVALAAGANQDNANVAKRLLLMDA